ncbi:hypothetical protein EON65_34840 [archaeon]|nr:MAG: hypothetical protein EON65_34840 [archaeon]
MWGVRGGVQLEQNKNSEYVLLVSAASHHYETTAFFAYHLKKMNIPFVTWLHHYATMSFDGAAQRLIAHYSDNIHYLVPDEKIEIPPGKIKLLIYVTMNTFKETLALCPRKLHDELYRRADGVLMVNHYAGHVDKVWQYCKPPKCTLFHLSPFIHNNIKHIMQNKSISNYQSVGIDPVFEPPIAVRLPEDAESAINTFTHNTRLVVVQGAMVPYRRKYEDLFSCIAEIRNTGVDVRLFAIGSQGRKVDIVCMLICIYYNVHITRVSYESR